VTFYPFKLGIETAQPGLLYRRPQIDVNNERLGANEWKIESLLPILLHVLHQKGFQMRILDGKEFVRCTTKSDNFLTNCFEKTENKEKMLTFRSL
jgi:hypothetical protein